MDIFESFATDEAREEEGVVVFLTSGKDMAKDPWIKVARIGNTAYSEALNKSYNQQQMDKKTLRLSDKEVDIRSKNAMTEILARTILLGFGNITFQKKPLQYSFETSLQVLRLKDFREKVFLHASDVELFRLQAQEEASGN